MTIREDINRRKRKTGIVTYVAFGVFALGGLLSTFHRALLPVALLGFAGFMAGIIYLLWAIRCPSCRGSIGAVTAYHSSPFSISRKIRFCPFCGVSLESQLEETQ